MSKIRLHGSSSGYTEIAPVAASGNNTLTLPDEGTIISKDSAGAIGITSVRATNAHFSGTTRVTTGITTTATITTAKVTTIQDASGSNSSTPEEIERGRVKAWVHFRGTAASGGENTILASYNVSSVTDNGTGDHTINFTSAFSDANYCAVLSLVNTDSDGSSQVAGTPRGPSGAHGSSSSSPTTSAFRIETRYGAKSTGDGAQYDFYGVYCAFIR